MPKIRVRCHQCFTAYELYVKDEDLEKWGNGEKVQRAFPYLTPGERELFISGTCNECFNKMFPEEE